MKVKRRVIEILNNISKGALENLNFFEGMIDFIMIAFFIMFFAIGFQGLRNSLFDGFFEVFVALGLILICAFTLKIRIYNGYLGIGNFIFLFLGMVTGITGDFSFVKIGQTIFTIFAVITVLSMTYTYFRENKIGGKN